jgi:hypothetical protein
MRRFLDTDMRWLVRADIDTYFNFANLRGLVAELDDAVDSFSHIVLKAHPYSFT